MRGPPVGTSTLAVFASAQQTATRASRWSMSSSVGCRGALVRSSLPLLRL